MTELTKRDIIKGLVLGTIDPTYDGHGGTEIVDRESGAVIGNVPKRQIDSWLTEIHWYGVESEHIRRIIEG